MTMKPTLTITMLGEFSIKYEERIVTDQVNRSKKVWTLLEYLLVNRNRAIPQGELVEMLWADGDTKDPVNTLKVLVHRVRTVLDQLMENGGKKMIYYSQGAYGWNQEISCWVDTEAFEEACHLAEEAASDEEKLEYLMRAIALYRGEFLKKSASEMWVLQNSRYFSTKYLQIASEAEALLYKQGRFYELTELCNTVMQFEPYDEEAYIYLMKALIAMHQSDKALEEYYRVSELFFREFGITPSEKLTAIYKEVVETSHSPEMNLTVIQEQMAEEEAFGCFYCEYEFFKSIYRLEARSASRTGQSVYIALLSVMGSSGEVMPSQKQLNRVMDSLHDVIRKSLRRGDVFTRYSLNQYLVMLPTTTYETSNMVVQRILKNYRKEHPNVSALIRYTTQPITPLEFRV